MLNPVRDKNSRHVPGGRRDDNCDRGLIHKIAEGKTSYESKSDKKKAVSKQAVPKQPSYSIPETPHTAASSLSQVPGMFFVLQTTPH